MNKSPFDLFNINRQSFEGYPRIELMSQVETIPEFLATADVRFSDIITKVPLYDQRDAEGKVPIVKVPTSRVLVSIDGELAGRVLAAKEGEDGWILQLRTGDVKLVLGILQPEIKELPTIIDATGGYEYNGNTYFLRRHAAQLEITDEALHTDPRPTSEVLESFINALNLNVDLQLKTVADREKMQVLKIRPHDMQISKSANVWKFLCTSCAAIVPQPEKE